jgi:antitoxin YefM
MQTIYQINANELDQNLLDSIKALFKHKEIEIVISERDETAYLLRSPANREKLYAPLKMSKTIKISSCLTRSNFNENYRFSSGSV